MKYECNLIKDLLPLYHDEVCSRASKNVVEAHLQECEDCREYYSAINTSDVVEDVTYNEEHERKKNNMFKRIKWGFIVTGIKKFLIVLKWLTLIIYLASVVMAIYNAFQWKAGWLYPRLNTNVLLSIMTIFVVIPVLVLMLLFYKSKKKWQFVLQALLQVMFLYFLPALILICAGIAPGGIWSSHTTKLENYHIFEDDVKEQIKSTNLDIIPSALPKNIEGASYLYDYGIAIDSLLTIEASWKYLDAESYEQEKERVLQKGVVETYEENGYTVCRMRLYSRYDEAEFGYNDETKAVFYRINGMW